MIFLENYVLYFSNDACPGCKHFFIDQLTLTLMCSHETKELPILNISGGYRRCLVYSKISDWDKQVLKFKIEEYTKELELQTKSKSYFK